MAASFSPIEGNSLKLRALGGDPDGRIHYTVMKRDKRVLLYLQVNPETELIHVLNRSSPEEYLPTGVQYIAAGGLKNIESEMIIEKITGEVVANINEKRIQFATTRGSPEKTSTFMYKNDSRSKELIVAVKYAGAYGMHDDATIKGYKKGCSLQIGFKISTSPLLRLVMLLASIKLYYCLFKYSSLPIPKQIPALMPRVSSAPDIRDIIKGTNDFRLRVSCESETGSRYIDLLDENTRLVLMVIEYGGTRGLKILFLDSFGDMKYYSEDSYSSSVDSQVLHVYKSDGKKIGSCDNEKYYDSLLQVVATKEILGKRMKIYKVNERTRLAVATDEDGSSSVLINFCTELEVAMKFLVIADVFSYAYKILKVLQINMPIFRKYPFKKTLC